MPNTLSALPSSTYNLTHDPRQSVYGNVQSDLADNPFGAMTDALLFGAVNEFLGVVDDVTGLDLLGIVSPLEALLGAHTGLLSGLLGFLTPGLGTTTPNVLSPIMGLLNINTLASLPIAIAQLGINAVLSILGLGGTSAPTGGGTSSTDPLAGLIGLLTAIPLDLIALLLGGNASQQAQIDALASGGFSYDPAVNGVSGWTTLTATALALSTRGVFIQPSTVTVAYRSSGISNDKYGIAFQIDPTMRGVTGYGICADSAGASWVGLLVYRGFDGDALWLVSAAAPTLWVVVKEYDLGGTTRLTGLTTCKLKTDGVNKFWAEINGHPVTWNDGDTAWTDSGSLASHNSTHRGVVLVANGLDTNEDTYYGPAIRGKANSYAA